MMIEIFPLKGPMPWRNALGWLLTFTVAVAVPSTLSLADHLPSELYKGRQITIVVGTPPGSSASLYSQAIARHMGKHLPGSPSFIVQHMPGAGGLVAANHTYTIAPRDGTSLVMTNRTVPIEPLLGGKGAQFEALNFSWIGGTNVESTICITWYTSAVKTLQDAMATEAVIGSYGADGPSAVFAKAANKLAGTKFKVIGAYQGGPQALLAMERGEVEGFCAMSWSEMKLRKREWLTQNKVNMLFQMGFKRHPELPNVPLIIDHARSPTDRSVFELLIAPGEMGWPFYAPPGIPAERLVALRTGFEHTLKDPAFLADAERMGLEVQHVSGERIQQLLRGIYDAPKPVVERAMAIAE